MDDRLIAAARSGIRVFDLGRSLFAGMPQSPNHPQFQHAYPIRHGDALRTDGGSTANDVIITGTHVGTHIDAPAHIAQDGKLLGGISAKEAIEGGKYYGLGIHTFRPLATRAVLLDVPTALGSVNCDSAYEITIEDLEKAANMAGILVTRGDVVLIRTGWGRFFNEIDLYNGQTLGAPGIGEAAANWLSAQGVIAAGSDTIAFERIPPKVGHATLPVHRILLVESGISIIENLNLEELAAASVYEFLLVLSPLSIVGATGAPVRPLALIESAS